VSLKLGHKIFLLVSVPLVFILLVIALFAFVQRSTVSAATIADHSDAVLAQTRMVWETILEAENNERSYILTRDPLYRERFHRASSQVPQLLTTLEQLVEDNPTQEGRVDVLQVVVAHRLQGLEKGINLIHSGVGSNAGLDKKLLLGSRTMDEVRSRVTEFNDEEFRIHVERDATLGRMLDFFNKLLVSCAVVAFGLSLLIMQVFSRILVRRLAELGDEARTFAQGGALRKTPMKGNDELSQLHHSFYTMADIIAEKQTTLARYQLLAKSARDIILFVTRGDLRIFDANDAALQAYEYDRAELLSLTVRDLRAPETAVNLESEISRADAAPTLFETRHRRKDGSTFPVEVSARTTEIDGQRVLLAVVRDITERKRAENEHEKFFDRSNDLMGVANFKGYFLRINSAWESALGHSIEEMTGRPFLDFVHPDDRERTLAAMRAFNLGDAVTSFECRYVRKDGSYVWLAWSAIPSLEEGLIYAVARDVTKRKQIEAELAHSRDQAMEASLLKSQFLANMSHEIRTPMNGIVATSELLLRSKLGTVDREYAGIIGESARALLTIITQILDLSKLEAGKVDLESEEFAPLTVAESVTELLKVQAAQKKLSLHTFVAAEVPQSVLGDAGRLRQILLNLMGNALKFTEQGAVSLRISVHAQDAALVTLRFAVADTGIGFSPQARERLFAPFVQADGSTSRRHGGSGLGLSISKRLVELMNGEIDVESELGVGSTFWFTARFERTEKGAQDAAATPLRGRRVLIVDSDSAARDIIARYAHSWGVRSTAAPDTSSVIPLLREAVEAGDPIHFLILDLATADVDAWRLSETIAGDVAFSATKLILATTLDARESLLTSGSFAAYLAKPVRQSQLHDCIVTAMAAPRTRLLALEGHAPIAAPQAERSRYLGARILLAEDHAINRRIAVAQLKELGVEADLAENGQEAIDAYERHRYDLILMDCQMPDVDGFAATRAIRAIQARDGGNVRIIAMTANAMEGDRKRCIEAGMDDYLSKPVELAKLRAALHPMLRPSENANGKTTQVPGVPCALDVARLRQVFQDDAEAIGEVLELSIGECRPLVAAMQSAIGRRQTDLVAHAAHKFKGICGNVGADELAAIGLQIERAAKAADWAWAQDGCSKLEGGLNRFVTAATAAQNGAHKPALREAL
jgi:two-component system sensor histidine kinase/response regulator